MRFWLLHPNWPLSYSIKHTQYNTYRWQLLFKCSWIWDWVRSIMTEDQQCIRQVNLQLCSWHFMQLEPWMRNRQRKIVAGLLATIFPQHRNQQVWAGCSFWVKREFPHIRLLVVSLWLQDYQNYYYYYRKRIRQNLMMDSTRFCAKIGESMRQAEFHCFAIFWW